MSFGECVTPFSSGHVPGFVPVRIFDPVQELPHARSRTPISPVFDKRAYYGGVRPRATNDGVEERCVPPEAVSANGGAGINIRAARKEPLKDFALTKIDGDVQQGRTIDRCPVRP